MRQVIMSYDYDRTASARMSNTATPTFDKLFQDRSKVEATLSAALKKMQPAAVKVQDAARKTYHEGPEIFTHLEKVTDAAYKVFEPFRPLLAKGKAEVEELADAKFEAAQQARKLYAVVREDLNQAYNQAMQAKQDRNGQAAVQASKVLVDVVEDLKKVFDAYADAYENRR